MSGVRVRRILALAVLFGACLCLRPSPAQDKTLAEADTLEKDAAALYQQGRTYEAILLAEKALEIRRVVQGAEHPDYAMSMYALARLYQSKLMYADAEPLYRRSLSICEKALGPDHPSVATVLAGLASLYSWQGRHAEAERLYRRSLAIRERALGPEHPDLASVLSGLAAINEAEGRLDQAVPLYERMLAILGKALGADHPDLSGTLDRLAGLYVSLGRYADAAPLYARSLAILERALGPDDPEIAVRLNNLAEVERRQSLYEEAAAHYDRSLGLLERALGPDHPAVATILNNIALLARERGRFADAEPVFKRSLAAKEKALGPDHPDVAAVLNNLATLYEEQGQYDQAEPLFQRSLAIRERALGPDHPDVAVSLNNLGRLYDQEGRILEAEKLYRRSLAISEKVLGPDHPDVGTGLNNLGLLCDEQGRLSESETLFKRSAAIFERALGPDHPALAQALNNLALLYHGQGRYAQAEALYKRGLSIKEKVLGRDHPEVAATASNLALLYDAQGRTADARPLYEDNIRILSRQLAYGFTSMSEAERLRFLDTVFWRFSAYLSFCLRSSDRDPGQAGKMYDVLLWEKGAIARSLAALRAKIAAGGDPETVRLFDLLCEKKTALARLAATAAEAGPQSEAGRRARIEQLEKDANDLEKEIVRRSGPVEDDQGLAGVTWARVREALGPGDAAVEFARFPFHDGKAWTGKGVYVAIVLGADRPAPALVVLGEQEELERIPLADYRRLSEAREGGRPAGAGGRFYAAFWQPLVAALGKVERIFVSPDGELNRVSFGIVPDPDGRPLLEVYDLRVLNSTKDLLRGGTSPAEPAAVLVGNPKFGLTAEEYRASLEATRPARAVDPGPGPKPRSRDLRGGALTELPGTEREIGDVASLLERENWRIQIYQGREALEERIKRVRRPRVLHLATHGFFEPEQPRRLRDLGDPDVERRPAATEDPMFRSGLFLAGADLALAGVPATAMTDDGVLTAYEASQMDLQGTEVVILSACDTGLGTVKAGEGVFGLRRAFQVAGARAVLMSMWSVPDAETRELVALFYRSWLSGRGKHEALREAQLEMRKRVAARYGDDLPLFWGAFVLVGP